jgi:hypothetical protein
MDNSAEYKIQRGRLEMTDLQSRIKRFAELRKKATAGEWRANHSGYVYGPDCVVHQIDFNPAFAVETVQRHQADAEFIATAANEAVPLLEECLREMERLEHWKKLLEDAPS